MSAFVAVLIVGLFLQSGSATTQTTAAALASAAWQAYESGDYPAAKASLERAVLASPRQPDYRQALAETEWKLNEQDAAIRNFEEAAKLSPSDSALRFRVAQIYQGINRDGDALRMLSVARPQPKLAPGWHFSRGFSLFRLGRFTAAAEEFKPLLLDPELRVPASFFMGNIAYSQNRLHESATYLSTAVEDGDREGNKAYNAYTYDYGLVLFKLGRFSEATQQFAESIERYSKDPLPWMFLGRSQEQTGNYDAAISALEKSIALDPTFSLSYYELARLEQRHGDKQRAEELFQKIGDLKQGEIEREEQRAMSLKSTVAAAPLGSIKPKE